MDELFKFFGIGTVGAIVGYLIRLLIEQKLRKELEDRKYALAVLGKRLDFLHQERGRAALSLVRLMKTAKMHIKLLVDPMQLVPVDQEQAYRDAHAACGEVHNLIAESSFLFSKPLEDQMLKSREVLWSILDEATTLFMRSQRKGEGPFNDQQFRELWRKLPAEYEPLEAVLIAEIRTLLGATDGDSE